MGLDWVQCSAVPVESLFHSAAHRVHDQYCHQTEEVETLGGRNGDVTGHHHDPIPNHS